MVVAAVMQNFKHFGLSSGYFDGTSIRSVCRMNLNSVAYVVASQSASSTETTSHLNERFSWHWISLCATEILWDFEELNCNSCFFAMFVTDMFTTTVSTTACAYCRTLSKVILKLAAATTVTWTHWKEVFFTFVCKCHSDVAENWQCV